jgi:post-segregation antitoxin (ccd killing protein)
MALLSGDMPSDTATIRVPRQTRDRLAARARDRGVSLSALLTELAENAERADAYRSEREATRAEVDDPVALAEYRLWEGTLEDGID